MTPNFMPPPHKQYYSLGNLCQTLRLMPPQVLTLASEAGVEPHEWRDGVPIFRGDAVEAILAKFTEAMRAISDSQEKCSRSALN